jgi:phosphoheptose isomerase
VGKESGEDWSQNLTKAIDYVNSIGWVTIGVTWSWWGAFKSLCKYCVVVPSDSTPVVEWIHSVISHIIVDSIRLDV